MILPRKRTTLAFSFEGEVDRLRDAKWRKFSEPLPDFERDVLRRTLLSLLLALMVVPEHEAAPESPFIGWCDFPDRTPYKEFTLCKTSLGSISNQAQWPS
ncbi:hypothetical protein N7454_004232 [Penicillium verhagenii]|nr:hypothetical protein N7454_004232 [Penicillium verhagenii]